MLDIALIRHDPDRVRHALLRRGLDPSPVDEVLRYDEEYRSALTAVERAKAEKNRLSGEIGKAADKAAAARELRPKLDELARRIEGLEEVARALSVSDERSPLRALLAEYAQRSRRFRSGRSRRSCQRRAAPLGRAARSSDLRRNRTGSSANGWAFSTSRGLRNSPEAASSFCAAPARVSRARSRASFSIAPYRADISRSLRRCWSRAKRCGRPDSSASFRMRCFGMTTPIFS